MQDVFIQSTLDEWVRFVPSSRDCRDPRCTVRGTHVHIGQTKICTGDEVALEAYARKINKDLPKRRIHTNWRRHPYSRAPKGAVILPGVGWAAPASEVNSSQ